MRVFLALLFSVTCSLVWASGGGSSQYMREAPINLQDRVSLQRGATLFVNHCMGCHSLKYLRYKKLATDLGIPKKVIQQYMNFGGGKIGSSMTNAMPADEAEQWFGVAPPDLTLVTRRRSADWVYSYLLAFYRDPDAAYGYNNHVFKNVAMPYVMADMQKRMSQEEFRDAMGDITNFLYYAGAPYRLESERYGVYVLVFLFILLIPTWFLYKEYWKDVE